MVVAEEDNDSCPVEKWGKLGNDMCHVIDNDFKSQLSYQQRNIEMCAYISLCPAYDDAIDDFFSGQMPRIHGCEMKFTAPSCMPASHIGFDVEVSI